MTSSSAGAPANSDESASLHDLLLRLDLASEVLEGLDELGVTTRSGLVDLMNQLERRIEDNG